MTTKQRQNLENSYICIKALHKKYKDNPNWIKQSVNENYIADRFIYRDTKIGHFFHDDYSLEALQMIYENHTSGDKKTYKTEKDHCIKTKTITREVWADFDDGKIPSFEEFVATLFKLTKIVEITRESNKDQDAKKIEDPQERYESLGVARIFRKIKNTKWNKIKSFEDFVSNYDIIRLEDYFV